MIDFQPPIVGCVVSDRNHTFGVLAATRECVIDIPTVELARKVVGCGNTTGRRVDEFKAFSPPPSSAGAEPGAAPPWSSRAGTAAVGSSAADSHGGSSRVGGSFAGIATRASLVRGFAWSRPQAYK